MPSVLPVHSIRRGASTFRIVDVIRAGPARQRKVEPGARWPSSFALATSEFQVGHESISLRNRQTSSIGASIFTDARATAGACSSIGTTRSYVRQS
jgi:hypothetical protein